MKSKKILSLLLAGAVILTSAVNGLRLEAWAEQDVSGNDAEWTKTADGVKSVSDGDVSVSGGDDVSGGDLVISGNDFDWERPKGETLSPDYSSVHDPSIIKGGDRKSVV